MDVCRCMYIYLYIHAYIEREMYVYAKPLLALAYPRDLHHRCGTEVQIRLILYSFPELQPSGLWKKQTQTPKRCMSLHRRLTKLPSSASYPAWNEVYRVTGAVIVCPSNNIVIATACELEHDVLGLNVRVLQRPPSGRDPSN